MARRPTVNLQLDPRNANHHTEESLKAVKRSVEVLGPGRSIVVDRTGTLIGGEATLKVSPSTTGMTTEVTIHKLEDLGLALLQRCFSSSCFLP
jgi:hypothetical protein